MENQLAVRPLISQQLATTLGMEQSTMLDTIKAQCFKGNPANVSDAQLAAFVSIAVEMGVNPLLPGMLYAFPVQGGGIVPMMGPDGVYKKLSEHPDVDGWETTVYPEDVSLPATHAITKIWRKNRERPLQYTALLSEWKVSANPNWNTRTRHMLSLRSLKQCARQVIHGVPYDEDERVIMGEVNVTNTVEEKAPDRPPPPQRVKKGASAVAATEKSTAIEAEIVPEKKAEPEKPEVAAEPAKVEPVAEPAKTEAPASTARPDNPKLPRAFLKDKEEINATCTVEAVTPLWAKREGVRTPSVQCKVAGDFVGLVLHVGGATPGAKPEDDPIPAPAWKVGGKVMLTLLGKAQKDGTVRVFVQKIAAEANDGDMEIEA